ncbi:unnamed protein product [Trifolium pratense]|uniref:Uncharacterized protein n=1 Tax=Trifolium pratense TaxID=57577 RepID=A0ACB0LT54_TRIPR|nr:unnamed protein product [Trifolium pratense]
MPNWTKNKGNNQYPQVGQWQPFNRKPPLPKPPLPKPPVVERFSPVPLWEKEFCKSVGSVPWRKVIDVKKSMYLHPNVVSWDDTAVKEAFDNAKNRFYAENEGLPCDIPLPDPNIYIDDVDWNAPVDPELYLDIDIEEARRIMEEEAEEPVILGSSLLLNQPFSGPGWPEPTGWGDEEEKEVTKTEEPVTLTRSFLLNWSFTGPGWGSTGWGDEDVTKPSEPYYAARGWESNQQYQGWWQTGQNDYNGWNQGQNQREQYGGGLRNKYQGRNAGSGNRGTWDSYNRKKENNMSWSKKPGYHHDVNDYQMKKTGYHHGANDYQTKKTGYHHGANGYQTNGGRKGNGGRGGGGVGGRRGNFGYAEKVAPSGRW